MTNGFSGFSVQMKAEVFRNRVERLVSPDPLRRPVAVPDALLRRNWRPPRRDRRGSAALHTRTVCPSASVSAAWARYRSCTVQADGLSGDRVARPGGRKPIRSRTVYQPHRSHYPCNTTIPCGSLDVRNDRGETGNDNPAGPRDTRSSPAKTGAIQQREVQPVARVGVARFQSCYHEVTPAMVVEPSAPASTASPSIAAPPFPRLRSRMKPTAN